jgi:hypothetical protein
MTVAGLPDKEFQGPANSCRSGSGPFRLSALPDVFELWRPSVFTSILRRRASREAAGSALQACSDDLTSIIFSVSDRRAASGSIILAASARRGGETRRSSLMPALQSRALFAINGTAESWGHLCSAVGRHIVQSTNICRALRNATDWHISRSGRACVSRKSDRASVPAARK